MPTEQHLSAAASPWQVSEQTQLFMHANSQHISALYLECIQPVAPNSTQLSCGSRVAPKAWPAAPSAEPERYPQESQQP